MAKQVSIRMDDDFHDELSSYANMNGTTLTAFCRTVIRQSFFEALLSDKRELERYTLMLSDSERYQLSNREKADLEAKIALLTATTKRFETTWADLGSEIHGEGGENA